MRLIDRIFESGFVYPTKNTPPEVDQHTADLLDGIRAATAVVADNVSEFLFQTSSQQNWEWTKDFPCCVPPFRRTWVECKRPEFINNEGRREDSDHFPLRWGVLFTSKQMTDPVPEMSIEQRQEQARILAQELDELVPQDEDAADYIFRLLGKPEVGEDLLHHEVRAITAAMGMSSLAGGHTPLLEGTWHVTADVFMQRALNENAVFAGVTQCFTLKQDGTVSGKPLGMHFPSVMSQKRAGVMIESCRALLYPAFLSLSFLNCKNVVRHVHNPSEVANRVRAKQRLQPLLKYYTLNINPMREVLRKEGGSERTGLRKALHICRGHFATYTSERPLFGRVTGTFWKPSHVKGTPTQGVIGKDYRPASPAA